MHYSSWHVWLPVRRAVALAGWMSCALAVTAAAVEQDGPFGTPGGAAAREARKAERQQQPEKIPA